MCFCARGSGICWKSIECKYELKAHLSCNKKGIWLCLGIWEYDCVWIVFVLAELTDNKIIWNFHSQTNGALIGKSFLKRNTFSQQTSKFNLYPEIFKLQVQHTYNAQMNITKNSLYCAEKMCGPATSNVKEKSFNFYNAFITCNWWLRLRKIRK